MAQRAIEVAPDAQWRLLIALWRFAGVRKMEVMGITWDDVLWDQNKVRIHATKTARYEGKEIRYVRLGPIRKYLDEVYAMAAPGETSVITRFMSSNSNLDKPLKTILHQAGLVPWPKLFQNMRASCETDWLNSGMKAHVVAHMMGHSVKVQLDHYAQVTGSDFDDVQTAELSQSKNRSLCASDDVGNDETRPDTSERTVSGSPGKTQKAPENAVFSGASSSGGGTRTPDPRIMIPLL
jgi:integrase